MNYASLNATDRRVAISAGLSAIAALLSFLDPSGDWGPIMAIALVAAIGAIFILVQPQVAPTVKLPAARSLLLLVLGAAATAAFVIAMLTYLGYISRNVLDPFVIIMVVGLIASIVLLWTGWVAYQAERPAIGGATSAPPPGPPSMAASPPVAPSTPPPPPPATEA
jgi:phosphoglycerol transferase MdoB-like AlkP superfamily enzyme